MKRIQKNNKQKEKQNDESKKIFKMNKGNSDNKNENESKRKTIRENEFYQQNKTIQNRFVK